MTCHQHLTFRLAIQHLYIAHPPMFMNLRCALAPARTMFVSEFPEIFKWSSRQDLCRYVKTPKHCSLQHPNLANNFNETALEPPHGGLELCVLTRTFCSLNLLLRSVTNVVTEPRYGRRWQGILLIPPFPGEVTPTSQECRRRANS